MVISAETRESMMNVTKMMALGFLELAIIGCNPAEPPPDIIKSQRESLNKAKAVEGVLQKQAEDQRSAADDAEK
jgi:hypothetical protein